MKGLMVVSEVHGKVLGMTHLVKGRYDKNSHVGFLGMSIVFGFERWHRYCDDALYT
jgi:hypothetical protein